MDAITTAYLFTVLGLLLNVAALGVCWHLARSLPGTLAWFIGSAIVAASMIPLLLNTLHPYLPLVSAHNAGVAMVAQLLWRVFTSILANARRGGSCCS